MSGSEPPVTYTRSAAWHDALYGQRDHAREAQGMHKLIMQHKRSAGVRK
jgi:hypothetical protein